MVEAQDSNFYSPYHCYFFKWDSESVFLETLGLKPDVKTITLSIALIFLEYVIS